jgi:hypothetical protein
VRSELDQRIVILDAKTGRCEKCGLSTAITVTFVVERGPFFIADGLHELTDCELCDPDPADAGA